jgi:CPA2 family monovalent cation:H+ antiporter-2
MILSESKLSQRATEDTLPLRDAFAVLFFVSVGMLLDPAVLVHDPGPVVATVLIIIVWKPILAFLLVRALGRPPSIALAMSGNLGHIGEFSFILVNLAVALGLMPSHGRDYVLAGAILSILVNPALILALERLRPAIERLPVLGLGGVTRVPEREALTPTTLKDHAVLIGHGRVGRVVADGLSKRGTSFLVIEVRQEAVEALRAAGIEVITGNAVDADLLAAANVAGARSIFVAIANGFEAGQIIAQATALNPALQIYARAHSDEEVEHLRAQGAHVIVMGETEVALGMLGAAFSKGETPPSETPIGS